MTTRSIGLLLASLLLAAGCKGRSHHDDDGPPPPTFLFYSDMTEAGAGLWAVNPEAAAPAAIEIEPSTAAVESPTHVEAGRWGGTSGVITSVYTRFLVYLKDAGAGARTLVRLDARASKDAATPVPEQLGATIPDLCSMWAVPDYARAEDSLVAVTTAGADGSCGGDDDVVTLVPVSSDEAATGTALPPGAPLVGVVRAAADGAVVRWLVLDGGKLWAYDPNGDPQELGAVTVVQLVVEWAGRTWLQIDGALEYYDAATAELKGPAPEPTLVGGGVVYTTDEANLYFAAGTAGASIFAVPLDGSAAPHPVHTLGAAQALTELAASQGRLVYFAADYFSVSKAGGDPALLRSGTEGWLLKGISGESLYFDKLRSSPESDAAVSMKEDGTDLVEHTTAGGYTAWSTIGDSTVRTGTMRWDNPKYMMLVESDAAGARLSSHDALSRAQIAVLGISPPDLNSENCANAMVEASGDATLLTEGYITPAPASQQRISLVRATQADSRVPIATGAVGRDLHFVGTEGCSTAGAGGLGAIALVLLALRRRRAGATAR